MKTFLEPLEKDEELRYLQSFKNGDQKAKEVLILRNLRLVAHIAKKYVNPEKDRCLEDLISVGTIGLIKAIDSFELGKGKLSTYCAKCIENELLMMLRMERKKSKEVSIYEPIGTDYEGNDISFLDIIESDECSVTRRFEVDEDLSKLKLVMEKKLTKREYDIINKRYGLNGYEEQTQREIAASMGISRSYVSRIEKRALKKLKEEME